MPAKRACSCGDLLPQIHVSHVENKCVYKCMCVSDSFGPESVKQAMIDLNCQRVGHGHHTFLVDSSACTNGGVVVLKMFHLVQRTVLLWCRVVRPPVGDDARAKIADPEKYVNNLIDYAGRNRITMEVCLTSNEQTMPWLQDGNLGKHTFRTVRFSPRVGWCVCNHVMEASCCTDGGYGNFSVHLHRQPFDVADDNITGGSWLLVRRACGAPKLTDLRLFSRNCGGQLTRLTSPLRS